MKTFFGAMIGSFLGTVVGVTVVIELTKKLQDIIKTVDEASKIVQEEQAAEKHHEEPERPKKVPMGFHAA